MSFLFCIFFFNSSLFRCSPQLISTSRTIPLIPLSLFFMCKTFVIHSQTENEKDTIFYLATQIFLCFRILFCFLKAPFTIPMHTRTSVAHSPLDSAVYNSKFTTMAATHAKDYIIDLRISIFDVSFWIHLSSRATTQSLLRDICLASTPLEPTVSKSIQRDQHFEPGH